MTACAGAVEKPTRVEFATPGRVVAFEKAAKDAKEAPGEWKVVAGGPDAPLKKEAVDMALGKLGGSFRPTGLVDPAKEKDLGFDAPKYRLTVTTESGSPRVVVASTDAECQPASCCNPTSCITIWEPQSCGGGTCSDGCFICLSACVCQAGACVAIF